jgi:uncharacterized delta-60 repeat protein
MKVWSSSYQQKRKITIALTLTLMILVVGITIFTMATVNQDPAQTTPSTPHQDNDQYGVYRDGSPPATSTTYWARTYGGTGNDYDESVQQTADGGYIVAGYTLSFGASASDVWVLKLNPVGSVAWQKMYGGSANDIAYSVEQTSDGGYIVAGITTSFGASAYDAWVLKLDPAGGVTWQKMYGGSSNDIAYSVRQTSDGGYVVAGYTASFGAVGYDFWVLKLDSLGSVTWQKIYGGTGADYAYSVQQTSDGGYIVAGITASFGATVYDVWVLKLDSTGGVTWQKMYGGSGADFAYSIQQTSSDGGYIVAGYTNSFGAGGWDVWVLKLDSLGSVTWQKTYGGSSYDYARSVEQTSDGGYIVAGYTYSFGAGDYDVWVLKLDSTGSVEWQKTYGGTGTDYAYSVEQTSDGGYVAAGYSSSFGASGYDFWVVKLLAGGGIAWCSGSGASTTVSNVTPALTSATLLVTSVTPMSSSSAFTASSATPLNTAATVLVQTDSTYWAKNYGVGNDFAKSIKETSDGGYIVAGYTIPAAGNSDVWLLKLDFAGSVMWQKTYGGTHDDEAYSVQQTSDGGYMVAGYTASFGAGSADVWVLKLDSLGSVTWQKTYGGTGSDAAYSVQQKPDGSYIVVGCTHSFGTSAGSGNVWVLWLNGAGSVLWAKTYGGVHEDLAYSVDLTSDGGYMVAGYTTSFGAGSADVWVLKLSQSGAVQWEKTYGSGSTKFGEIHDEIAFSVEQTSDGGYVVAGYIDTFELDGSGGYDAWVLKLNSTGGVEWQKIYGVGGGDYVDEAYSVEQTSDGGYIVAGYTNSYGIGNELLWVLKLNSTGTVTWQEAIGGFGANEAFSVGQVSDGGYIVAGETSSFGTGGFDYWVVKVRPDGDIVWDVNSNAGTWFTYVYAADSSITPSPSDATITSDVPTVASTQITPLDTQATVDIQAPDITPPAVITDLSTSSPTATSIALTWTAPGDDGTSGSAAGYEVKYSTTGPITSSNWDSATTYYQSWTPLLGGSSESHVVSSLKNATRYWFAVEAYDDGLYPNSGDVSNSPSGLTLDAFPPAAITDLVARNPATTSIVLTWTATGNNGTLGTATGYVVKYSTSGPITQLNWGSATTYAQSWTPLASGQMETHILSNLSNATMFWFAVEAFDGASPPNYGPVSNSASEVTLDAFPPGAITDLAVANPTATSITLNWTAPGDNGAIGTAAGYVVKYSTSGPITASNWAGATTYPQCWIPLPGGSKESHVVSGLSNATRYWFAVRAFDLASPPNYGAVSNSPSGNTLDAFPPAAITDLATSSPTTGSVTLTWTALGGNGTLGSAIGYVVKYSASGPITDATWSSATLYTQLWTPLTAGSTETHVVTGLNNDTSYWFAIKAYDQAHNYGGASNSPSATTATIHRVCWAKTYGGTGEDGAWSVQQTSDGGYIVTGYTSSFGTSGNDFWVLKLNSTGGVTWQKTYGGSGNDIPCSILQTADGGYVLAGSTDSFSGSYDFWILKLNSSGSVVWQKTYGGSGLDWVNSIQQTSDGGYIVAGYTSSFGVDVYDFWVLKLDSNGGVAWQRTYGGDGDDRAYSIQQTSDGGYIVAGSTTSSSFGAVGWDFWVLKLNSTGGVTWQKAYGNGFYDFAYSVQQTADGGYILAGSTNSSGVVPWDLWVLKLYGNGSMDWQKTYGGSGTDEAYSIQQTADGGYIVAGYTESFGTAGDFWVLKLNSAGSVEWQKAYGGSGGDMACSVQQTSDGGYIVAGYTESFGTVGGDLWVVKLGFDGDIVWLPGSGASTTTTNITPVNSTPSSRNTSATLGTSTATVAGTTATISDTDAAVKVQASSDITPPAAITDLTTSSPTATSITLTWTAPGDDEHTGTAAGYWVKYSTAGPINASNWNSATNYTQSWTPLVAGSTETHVILMLMNDTRYWFAIKAYDEVYNYGDISNGASGVTLDAFPPIAITNLVANSPTNSSITLTWTAPGDNGVSGNATGYIVKYSTTGPINASNWESATTYAQSWTPAENGTTETHVITGLYANTTYWFAVKAYDDATPPNYGGISNSPSGRTSSIFSTTPAGFLGQYGFAIWTDGSNVVVTSLSTQPSGTGSPPSGKTLFIYFEIQGDLAPGSHIAVIKLYYNITKVHELGLNETTLALYTWNSATSQWGTVATTNRVINSTCGLLTAYVSHFSYFAVFATTPTAAGMGVGTLTILIVGAAGVAVVVIVAAVVYVKRKR